MIRSPPLPDNRPIRGSIPRFREVSTVWRTSGYPVRQEVTVANARPRRAQGSVSRYPGTQSDGLPWPLIAVAEPEHRLGVSVGSDRYLVVRWPPSSMTWRPRPRQVELALPAETGGSVSSQAMAARQSPGRDDET